MILVSEKKAVMMLFKKTVRLAFLSILGVSSSLMASDEGTVFREILRSAASIKIFGEDIIGAVRPYGAFGYSYMPEGKKDFHDKVNYRAGVQALWLNGSQGLSAGAGLDAGYGRVASNRVITQSGWVTRRYEYIQPFVLGELNFLNFTLQAGLGPCVNASMREPVRFGSMMAVGLNIRIREKKAPLLGLPLLFRVDMVTGEKTAFTFGLVAGMTFYLSAK